MSKELMRLKLAVINLYLSGKWTCKDLSKDKQKELWTELRDAAGIRPGTATKLGLNG